MIDSNSSDALVQIRNLKKWFPVRRSIFAKPDPNERFVHAVDGVSFDIRNEDAISIVGESGCGKTTLARLLLRLMDPTEGSILFESRNIFTTTKTEMHKLRAQIQAVFQDPYSSLDPKKTVLQIVSEPLEVNQITDSGKQTLERASSSLSAVGLHAPQRFLAKFPYELSGGQRQRVAIARAMIVNPRLIVADEPVSMLDASIRAEILNLMLNLRDRFNLTYVFITHDLAVARYVSNRMAVMYLGRIIEIGSAEDVCTSPIHPYTKALLSALPTTNPRNRHEGVELKGEVPSAVQIPTGCRFRPRCLYAFDRCNAEPELIRVGNDHYAACWLAQAA